MLEDFSEFLKEWDSNAISEEPMQESKMGKPGMHTKPMGSDMIEMPSKRPGKPIPPSCHSNCSCKNGFVYVVKPGDTLYRIALMYNIKVVDILLANPYVNIYNLKPGEELCLPI